MRTMEKLNFTELKKVVKLRKELLKEFDNSKDEIKILDIEKYDDYFSISLDIYFQVEIYVTIDEYYDISLLKIDCEYNYTLDDVQNLIDKLYKVKNSLNN